MATPPHVAPCEAGAFCDLVVVVTRLIHIFFFIFSPIMPEHAVTMESLGRRVQAVMGVWREATQGSQHDPLHKSVAQQPQADLDGKKAHEGSGLQRLERLLLALQKHDAGKHAEAKPLPTTPEGATIQRIEAAESQLLLLCRPQSSAL